MDAVEEVKSRLAIEDVVGEYVQLKRTGRNWKGLSPFTNERTPSFVVSPEKQIWHDFSSGKGGDMFSFVMEVEGLDFRQALELLARKAGVDLEQYRGSQSAGNTKQKERSYEALELSTLFYQAQLKANQSAVEYVFKKRKFTKETALEWRLGYAPNNGSALVKFLKNKRFSEQEIQAAGLSARAYRGGIQDMFRGRIMIPLADSQGRVIGFTARLLYEADEAPKYINTPQTVLYDKSRHVFGLHLAKEAIRKKKYAVIAEGNLDVIMSHQAGVRQVVATAGTALTELQLKALSRFTPDIRLSFDADRAGASATERAIPIASKVGVSLSIVDIPSGKDPDELIKQDPAIWQKIIEQPKYALDWLVERYAKLLDLESAQGKREFSDVLLPTVRHLNDSVEQDHYLNKIAELIQVSRQALDAKLEKSVETTMPRKRRQPTPASQSIDKVAVEYVKIQNHLLAIVFKNPPLRTYLTLLNTEMFTDPRAQALFRVLKSHPNLTADPVEIDKLGQTLHSSAMQRSGEQHTESYSTYDGGAKPVTPQRAANVGRVADSARKHDGMVQSLAEYAKILLLQYEELYQGLDELELQYEAARLRTRVIEQFVKHEKQKLITELATSDDTKTKVLLEHVKELDTLLKEAREGKDG
jgi:DNA primase